MYQGKYISNAPKQAPAPRKPERKPSRAGNKASKKGTVIFYSIYAAFVILFLIAIAVMLNPLRDWLTKFEASQPKQKCTEVFQQLFADPDWEALYTMAGAEDTPYEGKEAYAAYMENLVGSTELTYMETSAGLSGDRKYIVKSGETKVATFTLTGGAEDDISIPEWKLGTVDIFFTRNESVTIALLPDQTAYVNGIALDDTYTIRTISTAAEKFLPEGLHGYRLVQQKISGFLVQPEVTVQDAAGNAVAVIRDEATGIYHVEDAIATVISEEEKQLATDAAETYAKYMIRATSLSNVGKLFDTSSDIYRIIQKDESIVQSYSKYSIDDVSIGDYYRYSDSLFSVWVQLVMNVTRPNGTVKEYPVASTFFFTKNAAGKWLVTDMINSNVQTPVEKVRLTFMNGDATLASMLVDVTEQKITAPVVSAPEGKVFSGWVKEDVDEKGNTTLTVVFTPDENGVVYLSSDITLEPLTLYAYFEKGGGAQ